MEAVKQIMSEEDKYLETVKRIMKATLQEEVKWEAFEIPEDEYKADQTYVQPAYRAEYNGRVLKIYRVRQREMVLDVPPSSIGVSGPTQDDFREKWVQSTVLEITDPKTGGRWQFPDRSALDDLYAAVQRKTAGVDEWMDDVLGEE
jgi:hypothetical protein